MPSLKLCTCHPMECNLQTSVDPFTAKEVQGHFVTPHQWQEHAKRQKAHGRRSYNETVADITIARVLVTNDAAAQTINVSSEDLDYEGRNDTGPTSSQTFNPLNIESDYQSQESITLCALDELNGYQTVVKQLLDAFSPPTCLEFQSTPDQERSYESRFNVKGPTTGPFSLVTHTSINSGFLSYETLFCNALQALEAMEPAPTESFLFQQEKLRQTIYQALKDIDAIKCEHWNRQTYIQKGRSSNDLNTPIFVDNDQSRSLVFIPLIGMQTEQFLPRNKYLTKTKEIIPFICNWLISILRALCHLSRDKTRFVSIILRVLVKETLNIGSLPDNHWHRKCIVTGIRLDASTVYRDFNLLPTLKRYICCTQC
ncbi:hypothetical protein M422DRAFT_44559 [Sphaerobolus stellatus SS14]|nr:hypothetical protein M422DRAFT_44559 [Sphaerobolus stellatus SS14]